MTEIQIIRNQIDKEIIKNIADSKFPLWIDELATGCLRNTILFRAYGLEDRGILKSKLMHRKGNRYERKFFATKLGKRIAKDLSRPICLDRLM